LVTDNARKEFSMQFSRSLVVALVAGTTALAMPLAISASASAAPLSVNKALATPAIAGGVEQVQWRHHGWHGGHRWHGGWRHGPGWRRGYYGPGPVLGGLAAGAIIGGAIASSNAQAAYSANAQYCSQRFKSYDPASGTYLGYDGFRHPCP
jgi:hypothetical protein